MSLTIHPMNISNIAVDAGRMTYLRNYGTRIWNACPFFVVTGGREPFLVDTSGSAEVMSALRAEPVERVEGFEEALARADMDVEDIKLVVHTHLMYDHCANSKRLPNARFVVQKKELAFARDPHPMMAGAYQPQLFEDLPFEIVDGDHELMPGVKLLFTPGHSPGVQSVAVSTKAGVAIITGFCCIQENFEPKDTGAWATDRMPDVIPPGIHTDMAQAYDSALRVKEMADIVIPFHDPIMGNRRQIPEE